MPSPHFPTEAASPKPAGRFHWAIGAGLLAVSGIGVWLYLLPPSAPAPAQPAAAGPQPINSTPFILPGIRLPPVLGAADADLADDAPVIGVLAGGSARAYSVTAMEPIGGHVVNDLVGGTPVTVTYCDRTRCVHAFTDIAGTQPMKIDLGGYMGGMLLKVGDTFFFQDTGGDLVKDRGTVFPYATHLHELTTWKRWKEAHPSTELYTGPKPKI